MQKLHDEQNIKNVNKDRISITNFFPWASVRLSLTQATSVFPEGVHQKPGFDVYSQSCVGIFTALTYGYWVCQILNTSRAIKILKNGSFLALKNGYIQIYHKCI